MMGAEWAAFGAQLAAMNSSVAPSLVATMLSSELCMELVA